MGIRMPSRQAGAVMMEKAPCQTQPENVWVSLAPEQQDTVFQTMVTICRCLATRAPQDSNAEGANDDRS
jgi:hypothetical protein